MVRSLYSIGVGSDGAFSLPTRLCAIDVAGAKSSKHRASFGNILFIDVFFFATKVVQNFE